MQDVEALESVRRMIYRHVNIHISHFFHLIINNIILVQYFVIIYHVTGLYNVLILLVIEKNQFGGY